ncbi:MAG: HD domain-containing protein, partial [Chloroflexota bacterium]
AFAMALTAFLHAMEPLKHLPRTGWVDREIAAPESVAAHSWRLAMLAWFAAEAEGLDANHAMRLALVHDLPEVLTGDRTPYDHLGDAAERLRLAANPPKRRPLDAAKARARKTIAERSALAELTGDAPEAIADRLSALWEDYAAETSPEARLVHQLDKLEAYLQGWEYAEDGRLGELRTLRSFRLDSERLATHPSARALLEAIEKWAHADERLDKLESIRPK